MMEIDMSNVKPSVVSALTVLLMVVITVPLAKAVTARWYIPGLSELIAAI